MAKPLTSWLVPSFSQHNLRRVVSGRCLHVSVTKSKFQDKFASLRQVNSPYSWSKFQICCTAMYLIRFLPNFAVFCVFLWISRDFVDLPEFRGSATVRNIRSPDKVTIKGVFRSGPPHQWGKFSNLLYPLYSPPFCSWRFTLGASYDRVRHLLSWATRSHWASDP